ncbi:DUF7286 family protein [Natronomonas marina]|uniref:DUF7286 family protein n=1 Tax=Natronomonas marina TaxID=2961939 RepID=UPI0020C977AD|nr:hypothetical protein [Natronomonas marina]
MNDRARVPFALVGVLVLVSSTTLAATVVTNDPASTPTVDRAMAGAEAETVTTLRVVADEAATETAARPVTEPANTTAGRALDADRPFRDALRLRIYLLARERLESVRVRRGGVVANASLPPVEPTTAGYREAIERVRVERAGENGTALRVEIRDVRIAGTHRDRRVATEELSPTFVVPNPALFLHDRTERYERRVNAPVTRPGLGRRLTARLYPIAWARGYAQYSGAPIANVVGTRHVELATNDALLTEQRAVFGASDPGGDRGVVAAGRQIGGRDLLAATGVDGRWSDAVLTAAETHGSDSSRSPPVGTDEEPPDDTSVTVGVNGSADRAFAETVGIEGDDALRKAIERAHTVQARVRAEASGRVVDRERTGSVSGSWNLVEEHTDDSVSLERIDGTPPSADGWETRDGAAFRVHETRVRSRTWRRGSRRKTTSTVVEREYRVRIAVQARTAPVPGAPPGSLDGPLASATDRAVAAAIDEAGGFEAVARAAVDGDTGPTRANATADSTVDRETVLADVRTLRDRTRNVSTTVPGTDLATGRVNPARRLSENLSARHGRLRGRADRSVAERTRVAAREAYLAALERDLRTRSEHHGTVNDGLKDEITEHLDPSRLDGALAAHRRAVRPPTRTYEDPVGNLSLAVETGPSYLPTGPVSRERIHAGENGTVHPLATRNLNVFTSPHGQVVEGILGRLPIIGDDSVSLSTAAQALDAMNGTDEGYDSLRSEVTAASRYVRDELVAAMTAEGVPASEARGAVTTNASTAEAAKALANGSTAERAASSAGGNGVDRDRLRVRLRVTLADALRDDAARPSRSSTNEAVETVKREFRRELQAKAEKRLEDAMEKKRRQKLGKKMGSLPAGMPLVPGYWYATGNVWYVEVEGTYERFVVRANRGDSRASTAYVREGRTARLSHDGRRLELGRGPKITVSTETVVVVVVPSGPRGVGDTDGTMDERSPGWPPGEGGG